MKVKVGDRVRVINDDKIVEATVQATDGITVELRDIVKKVPGYILVNEHNLEVIGHAGDN